MRNPAVFLVALALAFSPSAPALADDGGGGAEGEAALLPPATSPQPGARGEVEVRSRADGDRLEVEVEAVDPAVDLSFWIDDGTGTFVEAGALPAGSDERKLEFDEAAGGALPLGAASVTDLAGRPVEVRDGTGAAVLAGHVPALGEDDGDDDEAEPARGRSALMRDPASPFPDASGKVEVEKSPDGEELEIEAEHLDAGTAVEFFLEDAGGAMVSIGTATADEGGEAEIEFETGDGGTLPLGAASVDDLAGRRVEVRTADGTAILFGIVPAATTSAEKARARARVEDDDSDAEVRIDAVIDTRAGRERLRIDARRLDPAAGEAEFWVADGTGTLALAASAPVKHSGRARFLFDTRKGKTLPLGAETLRDLSGRSFEIRVGGAAVLSGSLPTL